MSAPEPISVSTETEEQKKEDDGEPAAPGIFGRLLHAVFPDHLNVVFINEGSPDTSDWIRAHDLGRQYLEAVMGAKVSVRVYNDVHPGEAAEEAMEKAAAAGAQVIFATTPPLISACRKAAAKYPTPSAARAATASSSTQDQRS